MRRSKSFVLGSVIFLLASAAGCDRGDTRPAQEVIKTHLESIRSAELDNGVRVELGAWQPEPPGWKGVDDQDVATVKISADIDVLCRHGSVNRRNEIGAALSYTKYNGVWILESLATTANSELRCGEEEFWAWVGGLRGALSKPS